MTVTSLIEAVLDDNGKWVVRLGGETVATFSTQIEASTVAAQVRRGYAAGRRDQRAETAAVFRGLLS